MITNKVAIITGASSGIGFATALALSKAGAKVAIGARRTDMLSKLEKIIKENGGEVYSQKLDVTKKNECNSFVENVLKKWGKVDILVNNAGLMPLSFFKNLKIDEWDQMIDVNIKGVLYCTGAVVTNMLENKSGHIINISSVAGRIVFPAGSVYCATKHAITAFSEGLRQELSVRKNIRVTCIEPGVVATELTNTITDESLQTFVESAKKMESLQAEDIANAIVYAVESPNHVNVNEILIRPTTQDR
ncbi:MAG: SDR family oxidoreductase [Nitrosarchaeum sp.]|nr:SDR family oxidoreductase [Nitrosarchaeum sp.]